MILFQGIRESCFLRETRITISLLIKSFAKIVLTALFLLFFAVEISEAENPTRAAALVLQPGLAPDLTCYPFPLFHTGNGGDPTAYPTHSETCPEGTYVQNSTIILTSHPAPMAGVRGWYGTDRDVSTGWENTAHTWPNSGARVDYIGGEPCNTLTFIAIGDGYAHALKGSDFPYCPAGQYSAGEAISVNAHPYFGASFNHWTGTGTPGSGVGLTDPLGNPTIYHMPATEAVVTAYFAGATQCHFLSLSHTGSGADPIIQIQNPLCPAKSAVGGETVYLNASPAAGAWVASWSGTKNDQSTALVNSVLMPSSNYAAAVHYMGGTCFPLALTHTGNGSNPTTSPASSAGCPAGQFVSQEPITLTAAPASDSHVASWTGTSDDGSISTSNNLAMPAGEATVAVNYELNPPCYTLTVAHNGDGTNPTAFPSSSAYCPAGQYAAGDLDQLCSSSCQRIACGRLVGHRS